MGDSAMGGAKSPPYLKMIFIGLCHHGWMPDYTSSNLKIPPRPSLPSLRYNGATQSQSDGGQRQEGGCAHPARL